MMQQGLLESATAPPPEPAQPPQNSTAKVPAKKAAASQETYDIVSGQIQKYVWKDGYKPISDALRKQPPENVMPMIIGRLLRMIADSALMGNKSLPAQVIFQAGMDLARSLSEIAMKLGVLDKSSEAAVAEEAFYQGLAMFGQSAQEGAISPEEAHEYMQLLQMLKLAKQSRGVSDGTLR